MRHPRSVEGRELTTQSLGPMCWRFLSPIHGQRSAKRKPSQALRADLSPICAIRKSQVANRKSQAANRNPSLRRTQVSRLRTQNPIALGNFREIPPPWPPCAGPLYCPTTDRRAHRSGGHALGVMRRRWLGPMQCVAGTAGQAGNRAAHPCIPMCRGSLGRSGLTPSA